MRIMPYSLSMSPEQDYKGDTQDNQYLLSHKGYMGHVFEHAQYVESHTEDRPENIFS
jgi:hypothetical protein